MAKRTNRRTMVQKDENGIALDPQNARNHPDDNRNLIRQSLEEVGPFRSIALDADGVLRAGEGVYTEAKRLGMKVQIIEAEPDTLYAIKRNDLSGDLARRAALYDNATSEKSEWRGDVIGEMAEKEKALLAGIFSDADLLQILAANEGEANNINLDYDPDQADGFAEGEQFRKSEFYVIKIEIPGHLVNDEDFKAELAEFLTPRGLNWRIGSK